MQPTAIKDFIRNAIPFCMMFLLIMHETGSFSEMEGMQMISYMLLASVLLSFAAMSFAVIWRRYVKRMVVLTATFFGILLIISIIFGSSIKSTFYITFECLTCAFLFDYYRSNTKMLLTAAALAFALCIFFNFYNMLQNPTWILESDRETRGFFLGGNYNQMGGRMFCGIITTMLCVQYSRKWLLVLLPEMIVCLVSLGLLSSMTSLTCLLGLIILVMIPSVRLKQLAAVSIIILVILFQIFVVFNGEGFENNDIARFFIEDILGKDITFTERTEKWYLAGQLFIKSPIIGYGNVDPEWYLANLTPDAVGPHNFIFAILINGGIVLFALFLVIAVYALLHFTRVPDNYSTSLLLGIAFFYTIQLMEVFPYFFNFYLLLLLYYYQYYRITPQADEKDK